MIHYDRLVIAISYAARWLYDYVHRCLSSCVTVARSFAREPLSV
jgi:hypothetical protein